MRTIISVGTDQKFQRGMLRLSSLLNVTEKFRPYTALPPGSMDHQSAPYAFKIAAIDDALTSGANPILWCDSSVVPMRRLDSLWTLIERQGYWFSKNYDYTQGEFCSDASLDIFDMDREKAFGVPQVVASCFGLDFRHDIAQEFLAQWKALAMMGAFKGPWGNGNGEASKDMRVRGHRHDQSAASHIAWKLGMRLTDPPEWFCEEGSPPGENTVLTLKRPR